MITRHKYNIITTFFYKNSRVNSFLHIWVSNPVENIQLEYQLRIELGYPRGIPAGIPAVPPFFGQLPSELLIRYPTGIPGRSGIPVGSIENILANI